MREESGLAAAGRTRGRGAGHGLAIQRSTDMLTCSLYARGSNRGCGEACWLEPGLWPRCGPGAAGATGPWAGGASTRRSPDPAGKSATSPDLRAPQRVDLVCSYLTPPRARCLEDRVPEVGSKSSMSVYVACAYQWLERTGRARWSGQVSSGPPPPGARPSLGGTCPTSTMN